jgi:non-canonical (house-cleaning) NTP pyrophosphatase
MIPTGISQVVRNPIEGYGPFNLSNCKDIKIYVASTKELKMNAAKEAVQSLMLGHLQSINVEVKGFAAESNIKEQPVGTDETKKGANNRLENLRVLVEKKEQIFPHIERDNILRIFVSMENGIINEKLNGVDVLVDRCYIICRIFYNGHKKKVKGFSDGVTVPSECFTESYNTGFNKTAGDFIAKKYDTNGTDWHQKLAGVSRKELIKAGMVDILTTDLFI